MSYSLGELDKTRSMITKYLSDLNLNISKKIFRNLCILDDILTEYDENKNTIISDCCNYSIYNNQLVMVAKENKTDEYVKRMKDLQKTICEDDRLNELELIHIEEIQDSLTINQLSAIKFMLYPMYDIKLYPAYEDKSKD